MAISFFKCHANQKHIIKAFQVPTMYVFISIGLTFQNDFTHFVALFKLLTLWKTDKILCKAK